MSFMMDALAPDTPDHWQKLFGAKSTDEIPAKSLKYMESVSYFDLIGKKVVSDQEVQLTISIVPLTARADGGLVRTVSVKKVRGEWRVGDLIEE